MQASATSTMSVTSAVSLANTGRVVSRLIAPTTSAAWSGWQANTWLRRSTFGQEMFASMPTTPGISRTTTVTRVYSSTLVPATETKIGTPASAIHGASFSMKSSSPEFCRPIAFSIPEVVSAMRGRGEAAAWVQRHALRDDAPHPLDVHQLAHLAAGVEAPRRGQHRRGQQDPVEVHGRATAAVRSRDSLIPTSRPRSRAPLRSRPLAAGSLSSPNHRSHQTRAR